MASIVVTPFTDIAGQERDKKAATTLMNNRLKERALSRSKLASFTEGTTLSRPMGKKKKNTQSLFDINTEMPSLLGDF